MKKHSKAFQIGDYVRVVGNRARRRIVMMSSRPREAYKLDKEVRGLRWWHPTELRPFPHREGES